jgi:uncharacterized RmlC-like cupin family protein
MTTYPPIRVVGPAKFDQATAQTPGSVRQAAVAPQLGIDSVLWGGLFEVQPGARTGIHHHGEQQTIAYVPAFLPHMEINPSDDEPFRWVVVRSTATPIVVNLPDEMWS